MVGDFTSFCKSRETDQKGLTFNARRLSPRCASHLPWEAGALDCLWPLFYAVLVTAPVHSDHLTGPLLDLVVTWWIKGEKNRPSAVRKKWSYEVRERYHDHIFQLPAPCLRIFVTFCFDVISNIYKGVKNSAKNSCKPVVDRNSAPRTFSPQDLQSLVSHPLCYLHGERDFVNLNH